MAYLHHVALTSQRLASPLIAGLICSAWINGAASGMGVVGCDSLPHPAILLATEYLELEPDAENRGAFTRRAQAAISKFLSASFKERLELRNDLFALVTQAIGEMEVPNGQARLAQSALLLCAHDALERNELAYGEQRYRQELCTAAESGGGIVDWEAVLEGGSLEDFGEQLGAAQ